MDETDPPTNMVSLNNNMFYMMYTCAGLKNNLFFAGSTGNIGEIFSYSKGGVSDHKVVTTTKFI